MGREFELKFRVEEQTLSALRQKFGPFEEISMETTYYDTPSSELKNLHWTLRRRMENGVSVCTVKTPAAGGGRGEWETEAEQIQKAIPLLIQKGAPGELLELTHGGVIPVCGARFTRLAAQIARKGTVMELALDRGVLLGGGRERPFAEVEVELKQGAESDVVAFARELAAAFALVPERKSKVQRALELL